MRSVTSVRAVDTPIIVYELSIHLDRPSNARRPTHTSASAQSGSANHGIESVVAPRVSHKTSPWVTSPATTAREMFKRRERSSSWFRASANRSNIDIINLQPDRAHSAERLRFHCSGVVQIPVHQSGDSLA